ncbi:MAG: isopeptide-forming domain-containing fimbrial protein, partial [Finegoldia magna]|nr:isopeptide-forming domain-containing fimbrial protein [Finegoldia magna]
MEAGVLKDWKPEEHTTNGGKIEGENIQKFFGAKSKEVAEVYFEVYKEVPAGTAGTVTGEELNKKYPSKEIDTTKAYQKVAEKMTTANGTGSIDLTEFLDKDGEKVKDTKFVIVENLEKSTYKENNKTLSKEGKAIPSAIVLPATIMGGDVLHLYPKNTDAEKPDVVKDYKEEFKTGDEAKNDALNNKRDQETIDKDKKDHQIGDKLDYRVETLFKENTSYQTAYWQDSMTAGLTYNQDLKVFIDGKAAAPEDYEIEKNDATGFYVSLTEKGLAKVNGAEKHLVALEYSATLNEKAIVNIPESNDVDFFYGN